MLTLLQPTNNPVVDGYALFKSDLVVANQEQFILDALCAHKRFETAMSFGKVNSTWAYAYYNLFALTVGSKLFFQLHEQFTALIRNYIGDNRELWFQC